MVIVGAAGNLEGKIVDALLAKGVEVKAIVRLETDLRKIHELEEKGVKVCQVDMCIFRSIVYQRSAA